MDNNVGNSDPAIKQEENAQPSVSLQQPEVAQFSNILEYPKKPSQFESASTPIPASENGPSGQYRNNLSHIPSARSKLSKPGPHSETERDAISAERVACTDEKHAVQNLKDRDPKNRDISRRQAELKARNISLDSRSKGSNVIPACVSGTVQPLQGQKDKTGANCLPLPPMDQMTGWKRVLKAQQRRDQEKQAGLQESCVVGGT